MPPAATAKTASPAPAASARTLPAVKFGADDAQTGGAVVCKVLMVTDFTTRAKQKAYALALADANGTHARAVFVGTNSPPRRQAGNHVEVTGAVKAPSRYCASATRAPAASATR